MTAAQRLMMSPETIRVGIQDWKLIPSEEDGELELLITVAAPTFSYTWIYGGTWCRDEHGDVPLAIRLRAEVLLGRIKRFFGATMEGVAHTRKE